MKLRDKLFSSGLPVSYLSGSRAIFVCDRVRFGAKGRFMKNLVVLILSFCVLGSVAHAGKHRAHTKKKSVQPNIREMVASLPVSDITPSAADELERLIGIGDVTVSAGAASLTVNAGTDCQNDILYIVEGLTIAGFSSDSYLDYVGDYSYDQHKIPVYLSASDDCD